MLTTAELVLLRDADDRYYAELYKRHSPAILRCITQGVSDEECIRVSLRRDA